MKVLLCHNYYQQPGGEDRAFADEVALLQERGCEVETFTVHNDSIRNRSQLAVACDTVWNRRMARTIRDTVTRGKFDVVHFHNTFPLLSPASWHAARRAGAAVVQTLHNFRLLCPQATFLRDGQICTDCVTKATLRPALRHRCYRESRGATTALVAMLAVHRRLGTYRKAVDRYIALTQFAADMFVRGGLPAPRMTVKPNFVTATPTIGNGTGGYALYVGRLSSEKGIDVLADAWDRPDVRTPLWIIGDGPMANVVKRLVQSRPNVRWLGTQNAAEVQEAMRNALCLLLPSGCFEGMPKTLVEAYAVGTPVVASRLGPFEEMVDPLRTGRLFRSGSGEDLARAVDGLADSPDKQPAMRAAAREEFQSRYTADRNWEFLSEIYDEAIANRHPTRRAQEQLAPCGVS